jgi:hypothetical protein
MDLKILKKAKSWADMQPGEWFIAPDLADQEGRRGANRVDVRCPVCHTRTRLNPAHSIDAQGRVHASVLCPKATEEWRQKVAGYKFTVCTWHEFVTLEGWTPEDAANAR